MRMVDLIIKKKHGETLTEEEIKFIVSGFVDGSIPDYQMSAFMMAVCFNGMNNDEIAKLTMAMTYSGDVMDLSDIDGVKVDKHSTGGVGDTTTIVIAPLVAACGGVVAKMSGRGLAHSGGTLDKLEAIPGMNISLDIDTFKSIVRKTGVCVMGQTGDLVPADKLMYALRDVTGTVDSIPLIASSVMSKKIAAGADAIVLDVKCGAGAFMQTYEEARKLAKIMVDIGEKVGRRTVAVITDMNQPLGMAIGNGLETKEAIELLSGKVPAGDPLYEVCMLLASHMLHISGRADTVEAGRAMAEQAVANGAGLEKLRAMIALQGGDVSVIEHPENMCNVKKLIPVTLGRGGYISRLNALDIGMASLVLGAGRTKKTDPIDPAVGLVMHKRQGDSIQADEPVATLYVNDETRVEEAIQYIKDAVTVSEKAPESAPIVYEVVTA